MVHTIPGAIFVFAGGPPRALVGCLFFIRGVFYFFIGEGVNGGVRLYWDTHVSGGNLLFPLGLDPTKRSALMLWNWWSFYRSGRL